MPRHGNYLLRWPEQTTEERFWSKVKKTEFCWIWCAGLTSTGYGLFHLDAERRSKKIKAHRFAYENMVGSIPEGNILHHTCGNLLCVNPAHLRPLTQADHNLLGQNICKVNSDKQFCPKGHPLVEGNLRLNHLKRGQRECATCHRERERLRWHRKREGALEGELTGTK